MLNTKINHTAVPVTNSQHSDEKSSQKCRCSDEECCSIKSQTFLPLTPAHIWKINRANESSSKILLSRDSLPKHLWHSYIKKEADAILKSVKHDIAQKVMWSTYAHQNSRKYLITCRVRPWLHRLVYHYLKSLLLLPIKSTTVFSSCCH